VNSCLSPASDSTEVTVYALPPKPVITASGPLTFCQGDSVTLTAPLSASYAWSNGSTTQSIKVFTPSVHTVQVSNANSCQSVSSDPVSVTVNPLPAKPVISASGPLAFCAGGSVDLSVPAAASYLWSNGATSQQITVSASGKYAVRVGDVNSCLSPASDSTEVTVYALPPKPVITASGPLTFCQGDSVTLTAPLSASYLWSNGSTSQSIKVFTSSVHTVQVSNANSCQSVASDPVSVTVNPLPAKPLISASGLLTFCAGGSVDLSVPAAASYLWSNGAASQQVTVSASGKYAVRVGDVNSCLSPVSDTVTVTVNANPAKPVISPAGPLDLLTGDSIILTSTPADVYHWSTGAGTPAITVKVSGSYSLHVASSNGCTSEESDPVVVTFSDFLPKPTVSPGGPLSFCEGGSVTLTAQAANSYEWSNGSTSQSVTVSQSGVFTVVIRNAGGVPSFPSDPVTVTVFPLPVLSTTPGHVLCAGGNDGSIALTVTGGTAPFGYSWSNGSSVQNLAGLTAGSYTVNVTDANNCSATAAATVTQPEALAFTAEVVEAECPLSPDGSVQLSLSGGTGTLTVSWDHGASGVQLSGLVQGIYAFTLEDANNCRLDGELEVGYLNETCVKIPGIITPNTDGHNDYWELEGLELYPNATVEVYDRRGRRVYYSRGYPGPWDGTFEGQELPMESYHYIIDLNNGSKPIIGNLTILR
jgi:gliding motility-associated-like protein